MRPVYIGVGSNLGERQKNIDVAKVLLNGWDEIVWVQSSSIYETLPVGGPPQGNYLNAVWEIETVLAPQELLSKLLDIENRLGRKRKERNEPRIIDLDILFYGQDIYSTEYLKIPHPRLHERLFILKPMMQLNPEWVHPEIQKTIQELYNETVSENTKS